MMTMTERPPLSERAIRTHQANEAERAAHADRQKAERRERCTAQAIAKIAEVTGENPDDLEAVGFGNLSPSHYTVGVRAGDLAFEVDLSPVAMPVAYLVADTCDQHDERRGPVVNLADIGDHLALPGPFGCAACAQAEREGVARKVSELRPAWVVSIFDADDETEAAAIAERLNHLEGIGYDAQVHGLDNGRVLVTGYDPQRGA